MANPLPREIAKMEFGKYLDTLVPIFSKYSIIGPQASMIQYQRLKLFVERMKFESESESKDQELPECGECCICLESFHCRSEMVITRCHHSFHPTCLVEALTTVSSAHGCPLCRCSVQDLKPIGFDGDQLRFFAMMRFNVDNVARCHDNFVKHVEKRTRSLMQHKKLAHLLDDIFCRKVYVKQEVEQLLQMLVVLDTFDAVNLHGFSKILSLFDKRSGLAISERSMELIKSRSFVQDCRIDKLRADLLKLHQPPPGAAEGTAPRFGAAAGGWQVTCGCAPRARCLQVQPQFVVEGRVELRDSFDSPPPPRADWPIFLV